MIGLKIAEIVAMGIHTVMLAILIYNLHAPRIRFLVGLSVFSALFSLGHLLEVFSKSEEAITNSYIVSFIGMSFLGLCYMLFAMEYRGKKKLPKAPVYICAIVSGVLTVLTLYTSIDKVFDRSDLIETIHVAPVIFAFTLWSYSLVLVGDVILARFVTSYEDKSLYKYAVIILGVVTLPVLGLVLNSLKVCEGYDLTPMSISIANSILIWYILNYRTPEWAAMGRHNAIETMTDGFLLVNNINILLDINQKVTECFPQVTRAQLGKKVSDIPDFPKFLLDPAIYDFSLEIPPNGKRHFMLIRSALKTEKGKRVGQNVLMVDDTINYDITEVLRHKTQHDGLTGLYNRTAVYDIAGRDYTLAVRAKRNSCMLMFDIDFFKKVNDTYGHLIGDEVLKAIGTLLKSRLRKTDIGARYGGEEFLVWVPDKIGRAHV
jgi:GGDEF domain-containing protein